MTRHTLQVGSYEVNCTLLENDGNALIVDPGQEPERIIAVLEQRKWKPVAILLTHGHFDHINAIPGLLEKYPSLPVYVSDEDAKVMSHPLNNCPPEYGPINIHHRDPSTIDPSHRDPSTIDPSHRNPSVPARDWGIKVIPTPGHTPGGVCYYIPSEKLLLSGDTLFAGSVGRTDLPGGDMATLMHSLDSLRKLPEDTMVIPGHGMTTTIGRELASNPFLQ